MEERLSYEEGLGGLSVPPCRVAEASWQRAGRAVRCEGAGQTLVLM